MDNNELNLSRLEQAEMLRQDILTSYTLVQKNLWDMCMKLKKMRDEKLYKELGFSEFNDFTQKELGMSDRNVYRYISVAENVSPDLVTTLSLNGISKLNLLATISDEEQHAIAEAVDLESVSVRELKEEINKLKGQNKDLGAAKDRAVAAQTSLEEEINKLKGEKMLVENANAKLENEIADAADENARLERENKELRERPVEVAVVENSDNERRLKETIKALEAENYRQNEMMDRKNIEDRRKFEADKKAEIAAIREEYEEKLKTAQSGEDKEKQEFKVFLVMAHDALDRLISAASGKDAVYKAKIKELLTAAERQLEEKRI